MKTFIKSNKFYLISFIFLVLVYFLLKKLFDISLNDLVNNNFGFIAYVLIGIIVLLFIKTHRENNEKTSEIYSKVATLLQTFFAIFAIWYAVGENKEGNEHFKTNLTLQDSLINKQDALIELQKELANKNLQALNSIGSSSGKIVNNLEKINNIVEGMPNKIDGVSASFALLTNYAQEEAEILKLKKLNNAKLYLVDIDFGKRYSDESDYTIQSLYIGNSGNLPCRLMKIELLIDTNTFYEVFQTVISENYPFVEKVGDKFVVAYDFSYKTLTISGFDKKYKIDDGDYIKAKIIPEYEGITTFDLNYNIYFYDENGSRLTDGSIIVHIKNYQ